MNIRYPIYEGVYRILTLIVQGGTSDWLAEKIILAKRGY